MKKDASRIHYMYIYRQTWRNSNIHVFAMLTEDGKYIQFRQSYYLDEITPSIFSRLNTMFIDYKLTKDTYIIFDEDVGKTVVWMYIQAIKQHVGFRTMVKDRDGIVRRICKYQNYAIIRKKKHIGRNAMNIVWDKLVKNQNCTWINDSVNKAIQYKTDVLKRECKIVRIGLYYMAVKESYASYNKRCEKKVQQEKESIENADSELQIS